MDESVPRHRVASALLVAVTFAAVLFAGPHGAEANGRELPIVPNADMLADEPFLIQFEPSWRRYSAPSGAAWEIRSARSGESIEAAYRRLSSMSGVQDVAFNYRYEAHGVPNDPYFPSQWNLQQINTPIAWDSGDGTGTVVAVLDSGVGVDGQDLACHEYVDPYNGITDEVGLAAALDDNGHGTHVTGTIAQCTDNGIGAAGVAPGASIMPVKVMDADAMASTLTIYQGMVWAIEHDADVINLSFGLDCTAPWPTCRDNVVDFLVEEAHEAGIVVVASSGNDGSAFVSTPANHPLTIAVGATTIADVAAEYSTHGDALDVVAPGGSRYAGIWQETFDEFGVWGYYMWNGTSMSAPHVTGTVALMLSVNPTASPEHVRDMLTESAIDIEEPGWDETSGYGRIDAAAAVQAISHNPGDPCPITEECSGIFTVSQSGVWSLTPALAEPSITDFYYGVPGDIAFSGDWNCNGTRTPGLYRQSDGFVYLRNSNTQGIADITFYFGNPGDIPIAGDFNGDGCDTVSLYRATEGRVYVINRLGEDGGGLGAADLDYYFGDPGDKPFAGDFNGNGIDTIGLHREYTGLVYFRNYHAQGAADSSFIYGDPDDQILAGDWNGDGVDTVAVFRPSVGILYVKLSNAQGVADHEYSIGPYAQVVRAG
jgi:serine protease